MIPEEKVAEIRERTDLVALVKDYVALKRSGASYKGLCPFHGEKSPSFYVHPDRGFYHCFGCQASGDAITFFMRVEGQPFPEAVRILAERAGVELTIADSATERAARQARAQREKLFGVIESAAGFFVKMLEQHSFGDMARAELSRRNVTDETAARFRLGYAPHGWDELDRFLAQKDFTPSEAEQVGLIVRRKQGDGHYDRFRHRLMFPITDPHGKIVAFSGRALEPVPGDRRPEEPPAKYVNSPESPLYHKGEVLFGLHEARVELRRKDVALLCEGNFDVLALSQAGFTNVVAPLGTAFTAAQAKLLRRYVSLVVLVFDADAAGRKAVRAAQPLLAEAGLAGRVVTLPVGEDPDSYLRAHGAESMQRLIDGAPGIVEHLIEASASEAGADARAKAEAIEALGPVIASVESPIEARLYVERVAQVFEVRDLGAVRDQLRRGARGGRAPSRSRATLPGAPDSHAAHPNAAHAHAAHAHAPLPEAEKDVVRAFLDFPSLHTSGCAEKVQEVLTSPDLRAILALTARWVGSRGVDASALLGELGDSPARGWLEESLAVPMFEDEAGARSYVERAVSKLSGDQIEHKRKLLQREILNARRAGEHGRADALTNEREELGRRALTLGSKR